MRTLIVLMATCWIALASAAFAQQNSPTSDPARSSATQGLNSATGSRSGSGTSTSGGRDDNGDQGRDAMPDSNKSVRPLDQQREKPDTPEKSRR